MVAPIKGKKLKYVLALGILDIFGFESFNVNGMEQLSVNYANEKMQHYFMETYLEDNRRDLQEEGFIDCKEPLNTINVYKDRLNVLEEALFLTLNDASQSPVPVNTSTIIQLACGNVHNMQRRFLSEKNENFIVEHYSGTVAYSIKDLLSKNTDKVPTEISATFSNSQNKFLRSLFSVSEENQCHAMKMSAKKRTMLAKLKYSMDTLIKELRKCDLHYVRCVKPSRSGDRQWNREDLKKQLACTGIFDALPLAKCKYPIRLTYKEFCKRYSKKPTETQDVHDKCKLILESIASKRELSSSMHQGKRLIFLTESIFHRLEICRRNYRVKCANKIQIYWLKYKERKTRPATKYLKSIYTLHDQSKDTRITSEYESNESCSLEEDDDVFVTNYANETPISLSRERSNTSSLELYQEESADLIGNNIEDLKSSEILDLKVDTTNDVTISQLKSKLPEESRRNSKDLQNNLVNVDSSVKDELESLCFTECLEGIALLLNDRQAKYDEDLSSSESGVDINCNTCVKNHTQSYATFDHSHNNAKLISKTDKEMYILDYDENGILYTIQIGKHTFFYKNRILSRHRPSTVPIKVHTSSTCLVNSHILPRSALPRGLQDCL